MKKLLIIFIVCSPILTYPQDSYKIGFTNSINYGNILTTYSLSNGFANKYETILLLNENINFYFLKNFSINIGVIQGKTERSNALEDFVAIHKFYNIGLGYTFTKNKFSITSNVNFSRAISINTYTYSISQNIYTNLYTPMHYTALLEIIPKYYVYKSFYLGANFNYFLGYGYSAGISIGGNI